MFWLLQDLEDLLLCPIELWWKVTEIIHANPGHVNKSRKVWSSLSFEKFGVLSSTLSWFLWFLPQCLFPGFSSWSDCLSGFDSDSSWCSASGNYKTFSLKHVSGPLLNPGSGLSRRGHQITRREAPGKMSFSQRSTIHGAPAVWHPVWSISSHWDNCGHKYYHPDITNEPTEFREV